MASLKLKNKSEYDEIKFVADYFKLIKSNLSALGYDEEELVTTALKICDKKLGVDTMAAMVGELAENDDDIISRPAKKLEDVGTTDLGRFFKVPPAKVNQLFLKYGLIIKHGKGYVNTELGKKHGAITKQPQNPEHSPRVVWNSDAYDLVDVLIRGNSSEIRQYLEFDINSLSTQGTSS